MIGTTLAHYRILKQLGEGAMGQVFLAEDRRLGRKIALKVLPEEMAAKPDRIERFRREARAIAALNHPNIVTIYSVEDADGATFLTMEYVDGEMLSSRVRHGGMPVDDFLKIARPFAEALAVAHERGITHRDLKPTNVMLTRDGRLKILDFGLAKLQEDSSAGDDEPTIAYKAGLTELGTVLGTMPYMSPEQAQGEVVDHRSDIFSLGVIFYELLTGERPFKGESSAELISAILRDSPREVTQIRVDLPNHLGRIIRRCLEKDPGRRFQSARDLTLELDELARGEQKEEKTAPSVAVLPFADMSPEKDQDYFCEGIAEELINGLGRIENLRVASRTSSFQFKGTSADVREIGRQLGVAHILEGSIRKAGNQLRITAQLVNVSDGYRLWSDRYDREMKDIFAIQDEIAESIVNALEVTLSPKERRAIQNVATRQVEAYDLYLRGRKYFYELSRASLEYARELYSNAIEIDPNYALAYAGIADCCSFLYMYSQANEENMRLAEENSRKALELDPELAESHASRGLALTVTKNFAEAEAEFKEAIRLNPKLYETYYYSGRNYLAEGRYAEAEEMLRKASEVRPEDYQCVKFLAQVLTSMDRPEEEIREVYREVERRVAAHVQMNPGDSRAFIFGASARFGLGDREGGLEWTDRAREISPDEPMVLYNVACTYALADKPEDAIDVLEQAVASGWGHKEWIEHDSDLDPLRDNPRFRTLLEGM
jgi:serine/threonine protein kinase/Flp pilus assembly protein TadD